MEKVSSSGGFLSKTNPFSWAPKVSPAAESLAAFFSSEYPRNTEPVACVHVLWRFIFCLDSFQPNKSHSWVCYDNLNQFITRVAYVQKITSKLVRQIFLLLLRRLQMTSTSNDAPSVVSLGPLQATEKPLKTTGVLGAVRTSLLLLFFLFLLRLLLSSRSKRGFVKAAQRVGLGGWFRWGIFPSNNQNCPTKKKQLSGPEVVNKLGKQVVKLRAFDYGGSNSPLLLFAHARPFSPSFLCLSSPFSLSSPSFPGQQKAAGRRGAQGPRLEKPLSPLESLRQSSPSSPSLHRCHRHRRLSSFSPSDQQKCLSNWPD